MKDGIAIGTRLHQKMTDAWLETAIICFEMADDKEALKEFRVAFGRNPKHIIQAVERFPEIFDPDANPDLWDILAAIHLSKVKDDIQARSFWDLYQRSHSYDKMKEAVKAANGDKPRKDPLAERIGRHIFNHDIDKAHELICDEPEVAADLERRAEMQSKEAK